MSCKMVLLNLLFYFVSRFQGGEGTTITLTIDVLDVEDASHCIYDSLYVYDDSMFYTTKK